MGVRKIQKSIYPPPQPPQVEEGQPDKKKEENLTCEKQNEVG